MHLPWAASLARIVLNRRIRSHARLRIVLKTTVGLCCEIHGMPRRRRPTPTIRVSAGSIWNDHVKEMTDLSAPQRRYLMDVVFGVEGAVRETCNPTRSMSPAWAMLRLTCTWHVIPTRRYDDPISRTDLGRCAAPEARARKPTTTS